jgi:phosphohistidine phosphatase
MATWAAQQGVRVQRIVHSGKERARQTAELFAAALNPAGGVEQRTGLAPLDDPRPVAMWLEEQEEVMVVGHQPFLARLASLLATGAPEPPIVAFSYGAIVCLEKRKDAPGWLVTWAVPPALVP